MCGFKRMKDATIQTVNVDASFAINVATNLKEIHVDMETFGRTMHNSEKY